MKRAFAMVSLAFMMANPALAATKLKLESLNPTLNQCDPNPGRCRIIDQSGSLESWDCRNSPGHIRCYADVEYENGTKLRIWGSCTENHSDCWSGGSSRVEPCDD